MAYSEALVLRVNEIYHDVEEAEYENRHPEIFQREAERWRALAGRFISGHAGPIRLLDVGSGTGFVPAQVGPFLREGDVLICSDISARMLEVCRRSVLAKGFTCRCEFLKLDGRSVPLAGGFCDIITMNSVLHHIPDFTPFLSEMDRLLRAGGVLIIGHEPNRLFYQDLLLWQGSRLAGWLLDPRAAAGATLRRLRLIDLARHVMRPFSHDLSSHHKTVDAVNDRLLTEKLIDRPLTIDQMTELVDIQSPTAGGIHRERGIDVHQIIEQYLPHFELSHFETYNHLGDRAHAGGRLTLRFEAWLRRRYPESGATLLAVLRKTPLNPQSV
jgi:SAM-dependent methyltransferase